MYNPSLESRSELFKYLSILPTFSIFSEGYQLKYSDEKSLVPILLLLVAFIIFSILYNLFDMKLNRLTFLQITETFDDIVIPEVSEEAQAQLLKVGEEKVYSVKYNKASFKKTLKSVARNLKLTGADDQNDNSLSFARRTDSLVLRMRKISLKKGPIKIFDNFNATFMSNRINCLIGKNGAGKSMIFR